MALEQDAEVLHLPSFTASINVLSLSTIEFADLKTGDRRKGYTGRTRSLTF